MFEAYLKEPHFAAILPLLAALVLLAHYKLFRSTRPRFRHPLVSIALRRVPRRRGARAASLALKLALICLIALAACQPVIVVEKVVVEEVELEERLGKLARPAVVFLLDVSGSMGEVVGGVEKLEAAKRAIETVVRGLDEKVDVGLVAFDGLIAASVPTTENRSEVIRALRRLRANGGTMYTYALQAALSWLKPYRELNITCAVIMVTDGLPADPEYKCLLYEFARLGIPIHTIYTGPPGDRGEGECKLIAERTGGMFARARRVDALLKALKAGVKEVEEAAVKTKVKVKRRVKVEKPLSQVLALLAGALLAATWISRFLTTRVDV